VLDLQTGIAGLKPGGAYITTTNAPGRSRYSRGLPGQRRCWMPVKRLPSGMTIGRWR
jgi:hypothetical protein